MQAPFKQYNPLFNLLNSLRSLAFIAFLPASRAKSNVPVSNKPRPFAPKVLSPDCVHLRAGAKRDPLRKNPAP